MTKPNTKCVICDKPIYRIPSRMCNHNACSISCRNKYFSKDKHPRWRGGVRNKENDRFTCRKRVWEQKKKAVEFLGGKCSKCGYNKSLSALEFDHVDPLTKDNTVCDLMSNTWEKIELEIKKCVLLCANCHRERHHMSNEIMYLGK